MKVVISLEALARTIGQQTSTMKRALWTRRSTSEFTVIDGDLQKRTCQMPAQKVVSDEEFMKWADSLKPCKYCFRKFVGPVCPCEREQTERMNHAAQDA